MFGPFQISEPLSTWPGLLLFSLSLFSIEATLFLRILFAGEEQPLGLGASKPNLSQRG